MSDILQDSDFSLFQEPENFRPPSPPPTSHVFHRNKPHNVKSLEVQLVGKHSLWAHVMWNAGVFFAHYIDNHPEIVQDKQILELGAGAALPSMISLLNGAKTVLATDYPEKSLIDALSDNIDRNISNADLKIHQKIHSKVYKKNQSCLLKGYLWGDCVKPLTEFNYGNSLFDVIIMCDLVFNHSQHYNMLKTCFNALTDGGEVYCVFSHHRPWLAAKDLLVLDMAKQDPFNFEVEMIMSEKMNVMFEKDPGDEELRKMVFMYRFRKIPTNVQGR